MNTETGVFTLPQGYRAAGIYAGIKKKRKDIALLVSELPASAAGVFTTNVVCAAPVQWDRKVISSGSSVRAIVVNSGNANACTGVQGYEDTVTMAAAAAKAIGSAKPEEVLVCSTGVIGVPLPMETVLKGITLASEALGTDAEAASNAAQAILTTDTRNKEITVTIEADGRPVRISGFAKGSGMIHPNMATLLSFIVTDAAVPADLLQGLLGSSVQESYNMISVDGDTSTNDTVLVLANGAAGTPALTTGSSWYEAFKRAFDEVHAYLAKEIVRDGEGAGKFIEVTITGAPDTESARILAKSVITSNLVKTAFFGEDANWGRILCAMGYSGAAFDPTTVRLTISSPAGSILMLEAGTPVPFDEAQALAILEERELFVEAVLTDGTGKAKAWGCDLSYEYVRINGEYRS